MITLHYITKFAVFNVYDKSFNAVPNPEDPIKISSLAYSHTKNTIIAGCHVYFLYYIFIARWYDYVE